MDKPDAGADALWLDAILTAEVFATDPSFVGGVCPKIHLGDAFPLM